MPGLTGAVATLSYLLLAVAAVAGFLGGIVLVSIANIKPGTTEFSPPVLGVLGCSGILIGVLLVGTCIAVCMTSAWPIGVLGVGLGCATISFIGTWAFRTRDW